MIYNGRSEYLLPYTASSATGSSPLGFEAKKLRYLLSLFIGISWGLIWDLLHITHVFSCELQFLL